MQRQDEQGINLIGTWLHGTESRLELPYVLLLLLAESYGKLNRIEEALKALAEGLTLVEEIGQYYCKSELHRLKGELLLQQSSDNAAEAEACFQQAISIARNQSAKSWELRAATSLARLWQSQGKRDEAYDLLASVYKWFTEGFDTADLVDAKALLDKLSECRCSRIQAMSFSTSAS
jgi:predicted ATPase